jgi:ABC-type branched-subunit amino acid transport system substrate-binding protein
MFIGINDGDAEAIIRQSLEIGDLPTKFVFRGGSMVPGEKFATRIEGFASQILTRDVQNTTDPKVKDWVNRFTTYTKRPISGNSWFGLSLYDSVYMLAQAMSEAGTVDDPAKIAAKLKGMQYNGVRTIRYDADGRARSDIDIGMIKGGKSFSVPAKSR